MRREETFGQVGTMARLSLTVLTILVVHYCKVRAKDSKTGTYVLILVLLFSAIVDSNNIRLSEHVRKFVVDYSKSTTKSLGMTSSLRWQNLCFHQRVGTSG